MQRSMRGRGDGMRRMMVSPRNEAFFDLRQHKPTGGVPTTAACAPLLPGSAVAGMAEDFLPPLLHTKRMGCSTVVVERGGAMRAQVGIVGAGPAGLMLSHLLHLAGISSIVVEDHSRAYCEARVRAGLMENSAAQMLIETGVGERLQARGDGARWHLHFVQGRGAAHRLPQADRQAGVHLRPEGGRHRPDRQAARRRRADYFEVRTPAFTISTATIRKSDSAIRASRRRSNAISSAAATAFTASAGRAFRPACSRTMTASIRSAGSASCRNRRRRTTS